MSASYYQRRQQVNADFIPSLIPNNIEPAWHSRIGYARVKHSSRPLVVETLITMHHRYLFQMQSRN
jgi:hypothetical protein